MFPQREILLRPLSINNFSWFYNVSPQPKGTDVSIFVMPLAIVFMYFHPKDRQ